MARQPTRRTFLSTAGLATAGLATSAARLPAARPAARGRRVGPNDKLGIGIIGVGSLGGGGHHLGRMLRTEDVDVVAVCDVDGQRVREAVAKTEGRARGYFDYRQLLDQRDVDAVIIATPDHWHALPAIDACDAGKDVYCEKPLTLFVTEGRAIVNAARRNHTVFQVGTQQRSDGRFRRACDLVRNGAIGAVRRVTCALGDGPYKTAAEIGEAGGIPDTLDWNSWLGPAPDRDYHVGRVHYQFRWFFDYSGGKMTDWGAHHLDIAQWGLGTERTGPIAVEGTGTFPADNFYETAVSFQVTYRYANGAELVARNDGENGVTFEGENGEIFVSRGALRASDPALLEFVPDGDPVVISEHQSRDHHRNWLDCIRSRQRPIADVEIGHRSVTVSHLGNIAILTGRALSWDPAAEQFVGDGAYFGNAMLSRPYRSPWRLPAR